MDSSARSIYDAFFHSAWEALLEDAISHRQGECQVIVKDERDDQTIGVTDDCLKYVTWIVRSRSRDVRYIRISHRKDEWIVTLVTVYDDILNTRSGNNSTCLIL